jgi:hypothetical protein
MLAPRSSPNNAAHLAVELLSMTLSPSAPFCEELLTMIRFCYEVKMFLRKNETTWKANAQTEEPHSQKPEKSFSCAGSIWPTSVSKKKR